MDCFAQRILLPKVSINGYYERLLRETDEQETKTYLPQNLQQAKWLLNSLEQCFQ